MGSSVAIPCGAPSRTAHRHEASPWVGVLAPSQRTQQARPPELLNADPDSQQQNRGERPFNQWVNHVPPPCWSRWLHVSGSRGRRCEVIERTMSRRPAWRVVIFGDDARLFPSSAHAPRLCQSPAGDADQFEGPSNALLKESPGYEACLDRHPQPGPSRHHVKRARKAEKKGLQSVFSNQRSGTSELTSTSSA